MASNTPVQNGAKGNFSDAEEEKALNKWNPMKDDYTDKKFNSYKEGPGRNLPQDRHAPRYVFGPQGKMYRYSCKVLELLPHLSIVYKCLTLSYR